MPDAIEAGDIDAAVSAGVLDAQQAERLRAFLRQRRAGKADEEVETASPDDERFRLIGGFNDIFVVIGIGLVMAAILGLADVGLPSLGLSVVLSWGLAEIFTRRQRLALPSLVLSVLFAGSAFALAAILIDARAWQGRGWPGMSAALPAFALAAGAALIHHWRFRVPIDIALAALMLAGCALSLLSFAAPGFMGENIALIALVLGLAIFAVAMRYDLSDPGRVTRRSDVAFWLHICAAPLIVHAVLAGFLEAGRFSGQNRPEVLLVVLVFALMALVIDRRAILVAALTYTIGAIVYLLRGAASGQTPLLVSILLVGGLVLAMSIGWRPIRAALVTRLPLGALASRLPPVR